MTLSPGGILGWVGLAVASQNDHPLDIKNQLGHGNGYLYNGKYHSGKSLGNILFGKNSRSLGIPYGPLMWMSGKNNVRQNGSGFSDPAYKGESEYSGSRIKQGYDGSGFGVIGWIFLHLFIYSLLGIMDSKPMYMVGGVVVLLLYCFYPVSFWLFSFKWFAYFSGVLLLVSGLFLVLI